MTDDRRSHPNPASYVAVTVHGRGGRFRALTIDHIIPIAAAGGDDLVNLAVAHRECNVMKGTHRYWWIEQPMAA